MLQQSGNKICSCIVITEKGEQTTIPSGQRTKITVVTYGPTDESTLEIYYKGGFQTKIQYGEGAEDLGHRLYDHWPFRRHYSVNGQTDPVWRGGF
mgnify:CR=1 FL=1